MNKKSQILTIVVLSLLAVILIVCILKHNKETYRNKAHSGKTIKLSEIDVVRLMKSKDPRTNRYPGSGTLSWESNSVLRDPKLMEVMEILYSRSCPPPLISEMGGYAIYKEQNELLPATERSI